MSAGFAGVVLTFFALMRDIVGGTGGSGSFIDASDSWDNLRLFLEVPSPMTAYDWDALLDESLEAPLSELAECDKEESSRVGCGMIADWRLVTPVAIQGSLGKYLLLDDGVKSSVVETFCLAHDG